MASNLIKPVARESRNVQIVVGAGPVQSNDMSTGVQKQLHREQLLVVKDK